MQDNAATKRSLSVWFFRISFAEIAMASFKKVHEMLCLCLIEEIMVEEEFVLLYEAYRPSRSSFSSLGVWKVFANKDPAECKADFRVEKRDIPLLVDALRVPVLSFNAAMEQFAMESKARVEDGFMFICPKHYWTKGRYKNTQSLIKFH